jgi:hypothetical protein
MRQTKLIVLVMLMASCSREIRAPALPLHPSEQAAQVLVSGIKKGEFTEVAYDFPADFDLLGERKVAAFRNLEKYIQSQDWSMKFTEIKVLKGIEDVSYITFRGSAGGLLVLSVGYYYEPKEWRVDSYEFHERSFKRPAGESFVEYVNRQHIESKRMGKPYSQEQREDGTYFLEH